MVIFRRATAILLLLAACRQPPDSPRRAPAAGPQVDAVVVTVRTNLQPSGRTVLHRVIIAGSRARSTDEGEKWRLYDLKARTVTFVDDVARTYRTEPVNLAIARRRVALRRPTERVLPIAQFEATGARRQILGLQATQSLIRMGGYQRELWFAEHPQIPAELFSMIHGTAEPETRFGLIVAAADDALLAVRGFPLLDRAELPYGEKRMVVERAVASIRRERVPESLVQIPDGYRQVTVPDERRPPVASPPRDRTAPAEGSPASATGRKAP